MTHTLDLDKLNSFSLQESEKIISYWQKHIYTLSAIDIAELIGNALQNNFFEAANNIILLIQYENASRVKLTEIDFITICTTIFQGDSLLNLAARVNCDNTTFKFLLKYSNPYVKSPEGLFTADYILQSYQHQQQRLRDLANTHALIGVSEEFKGMLNFDMNGKFFAGMVCLSYPNTTGIFNNIHQIKDFSVLLDNLIQSDTDENILKIIEMELRLRQFNDNATTFRELSIAEDLSCFHEELKKQIRLLKKQKRITFVDPTRLSQNSLGNTLRLPLINEAEIENRRFLSLIVIKEEIKVNFQDIDFDFSQEVYSKRIEPAISNLPSKQVRVSESIKEKLTYPDFIILLEKNETHIENLLETLQKNQVSGFSSYIQKSFIASLYLSFIQSIGMCGNFTEEAENPHNEIDIPDNYIENWLTEFKELSNTYPSKKFDSPILKLEFALYMLQTLKNRVIPGPGKCYTLSKCDLFFTSSKNIKSARSIAPSVSDQVYSRPYTT